eukprot:106770-Chlamydomonas_euryale.AAC.1
MVQRCQGPQQVGRLRRIEHHAAWRKGHRMVLGRGRGCRCASDPRGLAFATLAARLRRLQLHVARRRGSSSSSRGGSALAARPLRGAATAGLPRVEAGSGAAGNDVGALQQLRHRCAQRPMIVPGARQRAHHRVQRRGARRKARQVGSYGVCGSRKEWCVVAARRCERPHSVRDVLPTQQALPQARQHGARRRADQQRVVAVAAPRERPHQQRQLLGFEGLQRVRG